LDEDFEAGDEKFKITVIPVILQYDLYDDFELDDEDSAMESFEEEQLEILSDYCIFWYEGHARVALNVKERMDFLIYF
jgi:hypothetical protein